MKKTKRIMLRIIPVLIVACIMLTNSVLASGFEEFTVNRVVDKPNDYGIARSIFYRFIYLIKHTLPIASIFTIIFCWIKYIVSSKEKKVKLRKTLSFVVIFAAFVFVFSEFWIFWISGYHE